MGNSDRERPVLFGAPASSFLTPQELHELTDSPLRSLQIAWLEQNRWVFTTSRLGNPKVLRAYAEQKLGLAAETAQGHTEPDFSSWKH